MGMGAANIQNFAKIVAFWRFLHQAEIKPINQSSFINGMSERKPIHKILYIA